MEEFKFALIVRDEDGNRVEFFDLPEDARESIKEAVEMGADSGVVHSKEN